VCDGHGDLLAEDIFVLDDGPRVLDCLDFNAELRWGDVLADVGFLAMDWSISATRRAERFWPTTASSRQRRGGVARHHYIAYRAHVRAKVRHPGAQHVASDTSLDRLQRLCLSHLERARVRLVWWAALPEAANRRWPRHSAPRPTPWCSEPTSSVSRERRSRSLLAEAIAATYRQMLCRAERLLASASRSSSTRPGPIRPTARSHGGSPSVRRRPDRVGVPAPSDLCRSASSNDPGRPRRVRGTLRRGLIAARFSHGRGGVVDTTTTIDEAVTAAAKASGWS